MLWHKLSLCHIQKKDYESAKEDLGKLLKISPRYMPAYLMRGEVSLQQKDTLAALQDFDKSIRLERYEPDGWGARAIVRLAQGKYKEAEEDLDQAIRLSVRNAGYYINRALARFHQNNLRGAMRDYDLALDVDPNNFLGHYNRGLLRAQVGDDNRAIEDFDFVLEMEPDNMMAAFNRGLLRAQTGDYQGAISDYSKVLAEYPNFATGYYYRAEARRKIGDARGVEQDELKLMQMQLDNYNKKNSSKAQKQSDGADLADAGEEDEGKTRKKSDKNIRNFRKIVIADESEMEQRYTSDYRGRVQNRNVVIKLEPMYALTYYEKVSDVKRVVHFHKYIDDLNQEKTFPLPLRITNMEAPLTEKQVKFHFAQIDVHTATIVERPQDARVRFMRGLDFYLVQDFDSSIDDFTQSILLDDTFFPAYFMRSLVRYKELEYRKAESGLRENAGQQVSGAQEENGVTALDYEIVKKDLDQVIRLAPDFVYAYYNRGNVYSLLKDYRSALADYDKAIELNPNFAEAYFNRGLTRIFLGENRQGIADLSKAGELGIVSAYNVIKRFTELPE